MNISKRQWFYFAAIAFPLFFLLHGVNEQFGLIRNLTIAKLLLLYLSVAAAAALTSKVLMKSYERSLVFTFFLLCIYFFFGAVKDKIGGSYTVLLPGVAILIVAGAMFIKKIKSPLIRASRFVCVLLGVCFVVEIGLLFYNVITGKQRQKDLGDIDHKLIRNVKLPTGTGPEAIIWIVMDEYSGNSALKKGWNFDNPVNGLLRQRGFFVADSARSPYNYTHYSLLSSLDMTYLNGLKNHSVIGYRDIVRGGISLEQTNALELLRDRGYLVHNATIYNIEKAPTKAVEYFKNADFKLINNQTLPGRIMQDIGWNFRNILSASKLAADSADLASGIRAEAAYRQQVMNESMLEVTHYPFKGIKPVFFMFHFMDTHEPFIYKPDGSLDLSSGFGMYPDRYVPAIKRANTALMSFIDSIQTAYKGDNYTIILQGDHGYKFDEADPLFEQEGCSILYAVYCSDLKYSNWKDPFNTVNGFRVLFNKYFHTNFPLLEDRSINLYYR